MNFEKALEALKAAHLLRQPKQIDATLARPLVVINQQVLVACNTNDYLGLSTHPEVVAAAVAATQLWGTGSTGSRFTSGNFTLHHDLEEQIAAFSEKEAAIVFNSGYDANLAVPTTLVQPEDVILSDARNHASIIDGIRLSKRQYEVYRHRDVAHLRELLAHLPPDVRKFIVTDHVFSMDGTLAPLADITALKQAFDNVIVVVDDAHGTGVVPLDTTDVDIVIGTLSKAVGSSGGFIATTQVWADYIRNFARSLIYTTALPPSVIVAASTALTVIQEEPWHQHAVLQRTQQLTDGLRARGIRFIGGAAPIVGVLCASNEEALALQTHLQANGLFATAIRPPTVKEPRVRITLSAMHSEAQVAHLLDALGGFSYAR